MLAGNGSEFISTGSNVVQHLHSLCNRLIQLIFRSSIASTWFFIQTSNFELRIVDFDQNSTYLIPNIYPKIYSLQAYWNQCAKIGTLWLAINRQIVYFWKRKCTGYQHASIPTVKLKIPGKAFLKSESRISVTIKLKFLHSSYNFLMIADLLSPKSCHW